MTLIYSRIGGEVNPEWLEVRRGKLTASDAGRLMGSPKVRQTYLIQKLTERLTGEVIGTGMTPAMQHGIDNEEAAGAEYEMKTGDVLMPGYWVERDGLGATPDFLVGDVGLVEVKCPQPKTMIGERYGALLSGKVGEDDAAPQDYWWQCQAQMAVTGREWCDLVYYVPQMWRAPDLVFWSRRIFRDQEAIDKLWEAVADANKALAEAEMAATSSAAWAKHLIIKIGEALTVDEIQKLRNSAPPVTIPEAVGQMINDACAARLDKIGVGAC